MPTVGIVGVLLAVGVGIAAATGWLPGSPAGAEHRASHAGRAAVGAPGGAEGAGRPDLSAGPPELLGARAIAGVGELGRGGTKVLPDYRALGFYGAPQAKALGALGATSLSKATRRLRRQARPYRERSEKPIYPAFELIATIALATPGPGAKYRFRQPKRVIRRYIKAARKERFLLILDIQPGRSTFINEVRRLRPFLRFPHVGIALDPEWNMGSNGVPGERIGQVGAGMVNRVARLMDREARKRRLPQKLLVVHQFTEQMVQDEGRIRSRGRVAVVMNADGFGTPAEKRGAYDRLAPRKRTQHPGFKLFYEEDTNLMSPRQVLGLKPRPQFVVYE